MKDKLNFKEKLQITIQTGLQLIPYVGGPLSTSYFSIKQEKRFKRIESFYNELANKIQSIEDKLVPYEYHDEESLISIIEVLNDHIEKEHLSEKREYFKNFFINILKTPTLKDNYDERRIFLDILANMTVLEFEVLVGYYNENISKKTNSVIVQGIEARLEMLGLLDSKYYSITTSGVSPVQRTKHITKLGINFIKYCIE